MDNGRWQLLWRLSANSTLTNKHLFALKIPAPNTPDYKSFSQILPQSQGGQARQGYINIRMLWDFLDYLQLRTLDRIVEAAITAGSIYATVDKADGTGLINSFIDIHGIPLPLEFQQIANARGVVYQNVTLTINNITVDADPSAII